MPTLRLESLEDINEGLTQLWRLPPQQRTRYLDRATKKLDAWARSGEDVQDLRLRVQRLHAQHARRQDV